MARKSIRKFIEDLKLSPDDRAVLVQHVQEWHYVSSGPGLDEICSDSFRRCLDANPPPSKLSFAARFKLEDALNAGFTSKEAYQMGIPAIGIVAVLVANVAFVGWTTPPGGNTPYWAGCDYPMFTSYLIVNGFAFMLSVASVIVVTAFPLVLNRTPHQAAWWGGIMLMIAMLAFIVAFLLAGFVTVAYQAPPPSCSSLRCTDGGIPCNLQTYPYYDSDDSRKVSATVFSLDPHVAVLNAVSNSSSEGVCIVYNTAVPGDDHLTLFPWIEPNDTTAVTQLLDDEYTQMMTLCMDTDSLPSAIDPNADPANLSFNVSGNYSSINDLQREMVSNSQNLADYAIHGVFSQLWAYIDLPYFCMSSDTASTMTFDVLCDRSVVDSVGFLSVSKTGNNIRAATAADSGAVLFNGDVTARQVSLAIKALAGVFAFVLGIIVLFLIKTKWY